jgi:rsbT co-antagonist protein RsbR
MAQPNETNPPADRGPDLTDLQQRYAMLVQAIGLMIYDYDVASGAISWSGETERVCGLTRAELNGGIAQWEDLIHPEDRAAALQALGEAEAAVDTYSIEYRFRHKRGHYVWIFDRGYFVAGPDGKAARMVGMMQDISPVKYAEEERIQMQAEIIASQQAALNELSTPLIPITESVVVLPLIGAVDSRRARQVMETLLEGVAERNATTAIIDITGVSVVDTQVANALLQAALAVRLLGARVILTGIRPEVAQTLVGLGVDLSGIDTRATLQDGIAAVLRRR